MSEHKEKILALLRQIAIPLFVGGIFGFLIALAIEWGLFNLVFAMYSAFSLIAILVFIIVFVLLGCSLYLFYTGHAFTGALCMVAGFKLLDWVLQWYLPIASNGGFYSIAWFWYLI